MPTSPSAARAAVSTLTVDEALDRILARIEPLASAEVALLDACAAGTRPAAALVSGAGTADALGELLRIGALVVSPR